MGCTSSKQAAEALRPITLAEREEAALGPATKIMDASNNAQQLIMLVRKTIENHLDVDKLRALTATQMITRTVDSGGGAAPGKGGIMYYVKVQTTLAEWPWIFVKIYEPPLVTTASPVGFRGMKKMKDDFKLITF
uniref:Cystatin domain-containing protein n=1 Tax=Odontella aurita TaxID=265563 RepID=A0A7S4N0A4_9STRA|mmetsp:Transcript_42221/g.128071  ORF Transcript_42221/g.128071 Transcript_42221/m.128071 type:complete len:135 (+) Transcript_42221:148-552(+)